MLGESEQLEPICDHVMTEMNQDQIAPTLALTLTHEEILRIRQALLGVVDLLERKLDMVPRTSQLRRQHKNAMRHKQRVENATITSKEI